MEVLDCLINMHSNMYYVFTSSYGPELGLDSNMEPWCLNKAGPSLTSYIYIYTLFPILFPMAIGLKLGQMPYVFGLVYITTLLQTQGSLVVSGVLAGFGSSGRLVTGRNRFHLPWYIPGTVVTNYGQTIPPKTCV